MPVTEQPPSFAPDGDSVITEQTLASRWQELIKACVGGQLLPFLGAGISINAALRPERRPPNFDRSMPRTNDLTRDILSSIKTASLRPWIQTELIRIESALNNNGSNTFADATQLYIDMKAGSEHPLYSSGAPLDMRLFDSISPSPAHRYLAWLVRENLFSEMISTNYDCALEDAYEDSWGGAPPGASPSFHAISDHEAYRRNAHERQRQHFGHTVPILRLYKINGCARSYLSDWDTPHKPANEPGFIVITERHLQSFSKRQWARDLFRDRFRCRKLVFSGFGAEEPQIRFTALDVLEEFSKPTEDPGNGSHCFLHVFEKDLSASQLQIAKAAVSPTPSPDRAVFTGQDRIQFGLDASSQGLTADIFWQCLYRQTILQVIRRSLPFSVVATWLSEHERHHRISRYVIHGLLDRLKIEGGSPKNFPDWLLPFFEFVDESKSTIYLMELARMTRQISASSCSFKPGYYEDFSRTDSIPLKLLCMFHVLGVEATDVRYGSPPIGFWITLPVPPLTGSSFRVQDYQRWVLIVEEEPSRMPTLPEDADSRQAICLTLKSPRTPGGTRRHQVVDEHATTWRVVSFEDLIDEASQLPRNRETSTRFRQALISPKTSRCHESFYASHQTD